MRRALLPLALLATPLAAEQGEWTHFHGDPGSRKFSAVESFTPETVGRLERAWEVHTGDVSDGSGDLPGTVWSATPVYANDTLYLGTPFYRILALDPATGEELWSYDSQSTLEALTQPGLKNRGVAYWDGGGEGPYGCEDELWHDAFSWCLKSGRHAAYAREFTLARPAKRRQIAPASHVPSG